MSKNTRLPSSMSHRFGQIPSANISRSKFDLSHAHKTTFDGGYLIPIHCAEVLPGDTINLNMTAFVRLATPLHPFMDNLKISSFFFFVPNRLLWENWEKFNGAQDDPADSTDFVLPTMTSTAGTGYLENSIFDHMVLPTKIPGLVHNTLHLRAYNKIYNQWFKDENLIDNVSENVSDGPDSPGDYQLLRRGKRQDYFTSSLPWPQKGDSVTIPLGTSAPITGIAHASQTYAGSGAVGYETDGTGSIVYASSTNLSTVSSYMEEDPNNPGFPNIRADLTDAAGATINELRQSVSIQEFLEKDARGGTRYTEIIKAHFNVTSPDARLQRAEYLGGGSSPISVSALPQTSETNTTPQGNLAAVGTANLNRHGFSKSFTEHGVIIGLVSVQADLTYQQGLARMYSRSTRQDFFWPNFQDLGEQTILNKEIYAQGSADLAADAAVFGYIPRYDEYRETNSEITGLFRSNATASLDTWHLSQEFSSLPTLAATFINDTPPIERVVAVTTEPEFLFDSFFKISAVRPISTYGVPGGLGRL